MIGAALQPGALWHQLAIDATRRGRVALIVYVVYLVLLTFAITGLQSWRRHRANSGRDVGSAAT